MKENEQGPFCSKKIAKKYGESQNMGRAKIKKFSNLSKNFQIF